MTFKLPPENIVIRPPVEAYSVLIPVTGGCSWNKCKFCGTYRGVYGGIQDYAIRPLDEVLKDIDYYADHNYSGFPVFFSWRESNLSSHRIFSSNYKICEGKIEKCFTN